MHDGIIKQKEKKRKWMKRKNVTLGWKPKRAVYSENEKISKTHGQSKQRNEGLTIGSIWSLHEVLNPFRNQKIWTLYSRMSFPNFRVYHDGSWRLSNCHIKKKWIFLRCLIFKEFLFLKKGLENVPPLFSIEPWK